MFHTNLNYDMSGRRRKKKKAKGEVYAKYKTPAFQPLQRTEVYRRETVFDNAPSRQDTGQVSTARVEPKKYTGTLVRGIATMHKSNAVPVIDQEQATDISRMRR